MAGNHRQQTSTRGPAQPSFVFRGHTAQIHSAHITRRNTRLVTGDADGWVVIWTLVTKRPLAVWKAHDGAILGTAEWGTEKFITHGRDHTLRIWQFDAASTSNLSTVLPADGETKDRPKPWLLHSLPVNTLNFCAFSICIAEHALVKDAVATIQPNPKSDDSILIAVPARDDKKIEIYQYPDEKLAYIVPKFQPKDTGMAMAVKLVHHQPSNNALVGVGCEGGMVAVYLLPRIPATNLQPTRASIEVAQIVYLSAPHTQPILSLDASPDGTTFFTSSADAVLAAHRVPDLPSHSSARESRLEHLLSEPPETLTEQFEQTSNISPTHNATSDPGPSPSSHPDQRQPELKDGYHEENTSESATTAEPLKFSKKPVAPLASTASTQATEPSGLSSLLSTTNSASNSAPNSSLRPSSTPRVRLVPSPHPLPVITTPQQPYKVTNTKHAGQQSLRVRSDGRLLVTGGWDSRVRVYSTKTLDEMAVLKWHKEGVYAVDFGEILSADDLAASQSVDEEGKQVMKTERSLGRLLRQREEKMQVMHWVVAGAKDGKVSLWEVF
ncbi:WD40 repeat-like protein [Byssothecium circinans]|uniref:ASTRA-associated protein 1 n=1 Tax=Byssothecium circinans TaxID=147558 RepID=A0A6A5TV13_9PLEO|nr:WD40 repeat-like protein [Byssothecium circinans]